VRSRSKSATAGIVICLALVASIVVLAVRADGREGIESTTNDGGAWLVNQRAGRIGHLNRQVEELSASVRVGEPASQFEVHQPQGAVVVHNTTSHGLEVVDERTHLLVNSVRLPERAMVNEYENGLVIVADGPFRIWRLATDTVRDVQSLDTVLPIWEGDRAPYDVSLNGTVAVADPGQGLVVLDINDNEELVALGSVTSIDEVFFDGSQALVRSGTDLATISDGELTAVGATLEPQTVAGVPSAQRTGSLVGVLPSGDVVRIDASSGEQTVLGQLDSDDPVAPIEHDGCVYAAGHEPPTFWVQCGDEPARSTLLQTQPGVRLRLRLVNEWVWVNDLTSGSLWLVNDALELSMVDDWGAVLPQNSTPEDEELVSADSTDDIVDDVVNPDAEDAQTVEADEFDEDGINQPPVAFDDDDIFTHTGRPVFVNLIANDEDPDNDVLLVASVENLSGADAVIERTINGLGIQVTPAPDFQGDIRFSYRITDGRGGSDTATGTVTVQARTGEVNSPPVAVTDIGSITAGEKLIINVMANDYDPDGDSLVLIGAEAPQGSLSFDPSGQLIFEPDTSSEEGEIELTYTIADDFGEITEGRVRTSIRLQDSNQPPDARNDAAVTVVNQPVNLNLLLNDTDADGDELFVAQRPVLLSPEGADVFTTITSDGEFVFIPEEAGTFLFSYAASDDEDSDTAQIRVEVSPNETNRPPVAVRDDAVIPQGESRIVYVLTNDGDPDGDIVGIFDVSVAADSGLRVESFLDVGFRVFVDGPGPARRTFQYSITDGQSDPVETTVVIAVSDATLINQPPLAQPDVVEIRSGASFAVPVLDNDFDPEGGPLRVVAVSDPTGGSTQIGPANSTVRVSVDADTVTSFSVTYDVVDEQDNRTASVIRVRVVPPGEPNRPPIARPDAARTPFETEVSIQAVANDSDPDGDTIRVESITSQPANGTATVDPVSGDVIYVPAEGYSGTDRLSYLLVDGLGARSVGEVLIGVLSPPEPNQDPVAIDDSYITVATGETIEMPVLANDRDPDGDQLRVSSFTVPTLGEVERTIDGRLLTYTAPLQSATDEVVEFSYSITDGKGGSATANISVLVQATPPQPDGAPIAVNDPVGPFATGDEVRVDVVANDSDPDGPLTQLDVDVFDDDLTIEGQQVIFAAPAESGEFVYQITDIDGNSATALISVEVFNPVPPVAVDDQFGPVKQGDIVEVDVLANDYDLDGEPEELQLVSIDGADTSLSDGVVTLIAPAESAQYSYTIVDADGLEATASLSLIVTENRAPQVLPQVVSTPFEERIEIDLAPFASDPDNDPLLFSCCQSARNGSPEVLAAGEGLLVVAFTPDDGFSGEAAFTYQVDDQFGHVVSGTVTVTVEAQPNRPPTAIDGTAEIQIPRPEGPDVTVQVDLAALSEDPDGDDLTWSIAGQPSQGLGASVSGSILTITATDQSNAGSTSLTFAAADQDGESAEGSIEISVVEAQNEPPVASDASVDIPAGNTRTIDLRDYASDNDAGEVLGYEIDTNPAPGLTVTLTGQSEVTVAATVNSSGSNDTFDYTVTDRLGEQSSGTVTISVGDPDAAPPSADADTAATIQGEAVDIAVLANDSDPLGQGLTIIDGGSTADGTVTVSGSTLTFSPNAAFFGTTNFSYTIRDAGDVASREATAVVTVEVTGRPAVAGAPTCVPDSRLVNLTWTQPANNGAEIEGYLIEHDQGGDDSLPPSTSHQWIDLENAVEYRFRIAAENRAGVAVWSAWSAPCTPDIEPERPSPPQVQHGDELLIVTWSEPENNGSDIIRYHIRIGGGVTETSVDREFIWRNLENGDNYTFQVAAENSKGLSVFSAPSTPEHPSTNPDAPVIGTTTRAGLIGASASGILEIHWTPVPIDDDGGDTITHYRIERLGGGFGIATGANANSYTWSGLPNGIDNQFQVIAVNRDGDSIPSAWSDAARACTVPSVPTAVSATPGDEQAFVTFSAPSDNGGCAVTDYDVRVLNTTGTGDSHTNPGTESVGPLNNGDSFAFQVRANNTIGSSGWVTTNFVIPRGLPKCNNMSMWVTSIGHNWAAYSWDAANFNGATAQGYEASVNNGPWQFISSDQSGSSTLNENTQQTVRLRPVNSLGPAQQVCATVNFQTCPGSPPAPAKPPVSVNQPARTFTATWNQVTIGCTSQPEVTGDYDIVRYEAQLAIPGAGVPPGNPSDIGLGISTTFGPLDPGSTHHTRNRACYATGCGGWSPWSDTVMINAIGTVSIDYGPADTYVPGTNNCWNGPSIIALGGDPSQGCYFVRVTLAGWSGTHTVRCFSTMNEGFYQEYASFTAGNGTHNACSYSAAGRHVIVVVDGSLQGAPNGHLTVDPPAAASNLHGRWRTN